MERVGEAVERGERPVKDLSGTRSRLRLRRTIVATALLGVVAGLMPLVPAQARPMFGGEEPVAEVAASGPAAVHRKVAPGEEVVEMRERASKTFATAEPGVYRTKLYDRPIHHREGDEWQEVKRSLAPGKVGKGLVGQGRFGNDGANEFALSVSERNQDGELARLETEDGHSVAFSLEGARPGKASPDRSGDDTAIVYRSIMAQVDLRLTSVAEGLKEELVLGSVKAPDTFLFPLELDGLAARIDEQGAVIYEDDAGEVRFETPPGWMMDSTVDDGRPEAISEAVEYRLVDHQGGQALEVRLDRAWLDDPARVYPVVVDPTYRYHYDDEPYFYEDVYYYAGNTTSAYDVSTSLRSGRIGSSRYRSYLQFGSGTKATMTPGDGAHYILNAKLGAYNYSVTNCNSIAYAKRVTQRWLFNADKFAPQFGPNYDVSDSVQTSGCVGTGWITFNVTGMVRNWENGTYPTYGFALLGSHNYTDSYRAFRSQDYSNSALHPYLEVDWRNSVPDVPSDPARLSPTPGATLNSSPGSLRADYADADGDYGYNHFLVEKRQVDGSWAKAFEGNGGVTSCCNSSVNIPTLAEGTYRYAAYSTDGSDASAYTPWYGFTVDPSPPSGVTISSTSHPSPEQWYAQRGVEASWTPASDATSGISGYGVVLDRDQATVPAVVTQSSTTLSSSVDGDGQWYLHVRARDGAGNWGPVAHRGLRVDTLNQGAPTVSSPTHPDQSRSYDDNDPELSWTAEDPSGIAGWSYTLDQDEATVPDTTSEGPETTTTFADLSDGTWWFHIASLDSAGNWSPVAHYRINVDTAAIEAPVLSSPTHPDQSRWYNDAGPAFEWTNAEPPGAIGHSTAFDQDPATMPDEVSEGPATSAAFPGTADGTWWFHVRSRLANGRWSDAAHYPVRIDTTAPGAPGAPRSTSHLRGVSSPDRSVDMVWDPAGDEASGISGYRWSFTTSEVPPTGPDGESTSPATSATSPDLDEGVWFFHVRALDAAGNLGPYASFGPIVIDEAAGLILPRLGLDLDFGLDPVAASDGLGMEQFFPLDEHDLGGAGAYTNLDNGNLVVVDDDASIDAQGLNIGIRRVYNSQRGDADDGLGRGWNLSVGDFSGGLEGLTGALSDLDLTRPLALADLGDLVDGVYQVLGQVLEFSDADGTTHRFVRRGGPGGRWESPPGVDLRVVERRDLLGLPTAYDVVRPDGVTYRAENIALVPGLDLPGPTWRLTKVFDRNANQIDYRYGRFGLSQSLRLSEVTHNRRAGVLVRLDYDTNANLDTIVTLPDHIAPDPATGEPRSWARVIDVDVEAPGPESLLGAAHLVEVTENAQLLEGDPARATTSYTYGDDGLLAGVVDARRSPGTQFRYEAGTGEAPRLRFVNDRRGRDWEWRYGPAAPDASHETTALSPLGVATTYAISGRAPVGDGDRRIAGANVVSITDPGTDAGPVTTNYEWSANRLVASTDGAGVTTRMRYNDLGLLSEVVEASPNAPDAPAGDGVHHGEVVQRLSYRFLSPDGAYVGCEASTAPPNPDISSEGYCESVGELVRVSLADGVAGQNRIADFAYDAAGNLTTTIERAEPDTASDPAAGPAPGDRATTSAYHPNSGGLLASVDGPRSDVADLTRYGEAAAPNAGYDESGRPTTITDAAGKAQTLAATPYGLPGAMVDRDGYRSTWSHDESDNLTSASDAEGQRTTFVYDANDNRISATSPRGNESPAEGDFTSTWSYDANDWMTESSSPNPDTGARTTQTSAYADDATLASTTSARGATTTYDYWPNRALRLVDAPADGGARAVSESFYDAAGRVASTLAPVATAGGERPETTLSYSPGGTLASSTRTSSTGEPSVTRFAYNAHGEQVLAEGPRSVDGVVAATAGTFDAFGQATSMRRRLEAERWLTTATAYDPAGNVTSISQPSGQGEALTSTSSYDALDRLVASTDPQNPGHAVEFSYDGEGAQVQRVDTADGAVVRRTVTTRGPDDTVASVIATDYDPATGAATSTLATCNYPAGADPASGHDADGNLLERRTLTADGPGDCEGGTLTHRQGFAFDERGWMSASTQEVRSPETGAMVSRTQAFAYDSDGAKASVSHGPTGGPAYTTTYAHNDAGAPTSTTDWRGRVSTTSYLASGAPSERTLGSGVATATLDWHPDGMPAALTWRNGANQVLRSHSAIAYDAGAQRIAEEVTSLQADATTTSGQASYGYDLAERLTNWTSPFADPGLGEAQSLDYDLDDGANIVGATTTGATSGTVLAELSAAYPNGRLATRTTTAGGTSATESFSYDGIGQETRRQGDDIDVATGYDPGGQTATVDDRSADNDDVVTVSDGAGRLLSRNEPGAGPDRPGTTLYFYWGMDSTLAEESDGAGNTLVRYACATTGAAVAQQSYRIADGAADPSDTEGTWRWLLSDADANVATVVGDDGAVVEQKAFDPYGAPQAAGSTTTDSKASSSTLGFQGAITDAVTGSVVLGPRRYDPSTARFSTADSYVSGALDLGLALDPLTGNRYLFAGANPVAFYDDGHSPYVRPVPGHPPGETELAMEVVRRTRERQERSRPGSLPAARRPPTKDGFCGGALLKVFGINIGRRKDGRCAGNNKFTDFTQGSDSDRAAIDPSYNNPFLNANQIAAEAIREYGPKCARGGAEGLATGTVTGGFPGAILGLGFGCSQEVALAYASDHGYEVFAKSAELVLILINLRRVLREAGKVLRPVSS